MGSLRLCMAARVGRVTFLRVLAVVEAPKGECEEWRTFVVRGRRALCRLDVVDVAAQALVARVFVVDVQVAALARARDMFALMFAEDVESGGVGRIVYGWKRDAQLVKRLQLART